MRGRPRAGARVAHDRRPAHDRGPLPDAPQTWHHGIVARWWAEFGEGGGNDDIGYFRRFVERGQPALDVGCGTGRLLLPFLRDGLDVDGCDASADMIEHCRELAAREGLAPTLLVQPMHELDAPRRYKTIFLCGSLGVGSDRAQTEGALRRFHAHLEPGGTIVIDNEVPYADGYLWPYWTRQGRAGLPRPWGDPPTERRRGSDGAEYALQSRVVAADPLEQVITLEMRAWMWRNGERAGEETHRLTLTMFFTHELVLMLERAGFEDVVVHGDHREEPATADSNFVVLVAKRP